MAKNKNTGESRPMKVVVVGAGPVGSLAALYAAQRGHNVEIYELRSDLRDPSTTPLNFTKSINLALSERGIRAMRNAGDPALLDQVMATTIPMRGRMIHGRRPTGDVFEQAQDYDIHGRAIYAVDRGGLNKCLLDVLEKMPNVTIFFSHKLAGADFRSRKAWFQIQGSNSGTKSPTGRGAEEMEVDFDLMIGTDGAHSAVRYHMMKFVRMDYHQEYIDTLWCEFQIRSAAPITPDHPTPKFRISPNHLHIWPGKEFMFIAIPSDDGSFTCTLFAPSAVFERLKYTPARVPAFFDDHFPGVTALIDPQDLIAQFQQNPHLPLISIKCTPYHFGSSAVILGDAAHAMVPFYGQGMNAGLEDVRILFGILDKYDRMEAGGPAEDPAGVLRRGRALAEYSAVRVADAHAINDLALQNYVEMRASVLSPLYRLRKFLEEAMSKHFPDSGWQTRYARISFGNERYSEVVARTEHQGRMLVRGFMGLVALPVVAGGALFFLRYKRVVRCEFGALLRWLGGLVGR